MKMRQLNFILVMIVRLTKMENKNKVIRIQELRRSNSATPQKNKKKYSRKIKFKK
jgi:hypothetical protein